MPLLRQGVDLLFQRIEARANWRAPGRSLTENVNDQFGVLVEAGSGILCKALASAGCPDRAGRLLRRSLDMLMAQSFRGGRIADGGSSTLISALRLAISARSVSMSRCYVACVLERQRRFDDGEHRIELPRHDEPGWQVRLPRRWLVEFSYRDPFEERRAPPRLTAKPGRKRTRDRRAPSVYCGNMIPQRGDLGYTWAMSYPVHDGKMNERFEAMIAGLETDGGMSIPKIAVRVGCSRQQIWRIASGQTKRPGYGIAVRIEKLHSQMVAKTRGSADGDGTTTQIQRPQGLQ